MAQQDDPYAAFGGSSADSGSDPYSAFGGTSAQPYSSYEPPRMEPPPADRSIVDRVTGNYDPIIERAAQMHRLDPRLLKGLIDAESSRNPRAVSRKGARGLGQIMPDTARGYGVDPSTLEDPEVNINLAAKILSDSLDWAKGDTRLALRHYQGGPNTKIWGPENAAYPDLVLSRAMRYNAPDEWDSARGFREGLVGTAADWYGESARKNLRAGNLDAATQDLLQSYQGQQYIRDHARPQDQLSEVEGLGDLLTSASHSIGSGIGTSLPALGYAGAGAAAGSVLGPLGAIGGGLAGGAYGLMHQMSGNTLRGAVDEILNGTPATEESVKAALAKLTPADLARIERAGMARGALELIPEVVTGGMAKIFPVGKAVDLLSKPLQKTLGAGVVGAAQEMADVPLEAYGTGGDYTGKDLINAGGAGFFGEGGIVAGSNPRGVGAQLRGLTDENYRPQYMPYAQGEYAQGNEPLSRDQYARQFYEDRNLREKTRAAMDAQQVRDAMPSAEELAAQEAAAQQTELDAQRAAEPAPLPTFKELKAQMVAEHEAKVKAAQPPKVVQADLDNAVEQYLAENPEAEAVPAHLNDLKSYRKYVAGTNPSKDKKPAAPTNQDVYARLKQMRFEREKNLWHYGANVPFTYDESPQADMFGYDTPDQRPPVPQDTVAPAQEMPQSDPRQMEIDYGRSGYAGRRLLTHSGDIFAGQEPQQEQSGQLDMFGGGGQLPAAPVEEIATTQDVDPRQQSIRFPINDAASNRKYEAAFNQADREAAQQKARDEAKAAQVTRNKNLGTVQAQEQIANQEVAAEAAPDLGLKKRQVKALNRAEAAAAEQAAKAEEAKVTARETFVTEANAAVGPDAEGNPQIRPDDILNDDGRLFPKSRRGRAGKGLEFVDITDSNGQVVGRVKRAKSAAPVAETGPNPDQIIAEKLAEQQKLLAEKDAKDEVTDPKLDALIKKVDSLNLKPKKKVDPTLEQDIRDAELNAEDENEDYVSYDDLNDFSAGAGMDFDYSLTEDGKANNPTDAGRVGKTVEDLTGKQSNWKVIVHNTVAEAEQALGRPLKKNAKAFVTGGKAHFILENIPKGSELGVFLHEVGAHLGMERILSAEQRSRLANKIQQWAESGKGVEGEAARAAMKRAGDNQKEQIAYFVEEAVKRGVNPTALDMKSDVGRWFRQLWAAMKTALRRLGIKNIDNLSAQDVVNLAYGAARLELSGNWHGSAKNFNKFSNKHRGTGEGGLKEGSDDFRDMIAFGQYFAGKRGTAEGYRDAHVRRDDKPVPVGEAGLSHLIGQTFYTSRRARESSPVLTVTKDTTVERPLRNWGTGPTVFFDFDGVMEPHRSLLGTETNAQILSTAEAAAVLARLGNGSGTLFNVDFNIKDDEWLDWDKHYEDQSQKVKDALLPLIEKSNWSDSVRMAARRAGVSPRSWLGGAEIYRSLAKVLDSEKAASEKLDSLGIKGVRYLDNRSRNATMGADGKLPVRTYNYVVFDPKNVVVGNKNSERIESDDIQYSLKDFVDSEVKPNAQGTWDWANGLIKDAVVAMNDIAYLARWRSDLKSLQKIHQSEMAMQKSYNKMADSVMAEVDNIRALPREIQRRLYQLMLDATRTRIHPDQPFKSEGNLHLKDTDKAAYDLLRQQYEALRRASPAAVKAYADVRDSFEAMHDQRKQALGKLADRIMTPRKAAEVKQSIDMLSTQSPGPYFPLVRFGSHVAVWKSADYLEAEAAKNNTELAKLKQDPNHYRVSFEDSQDAAWRMVRGWREELGDDRTDAKSGYAAERNDYLSAVNQSLTPLLQKMQESVEVSMSGATKKEINEAKDALALTFFTSLPDTSIFMNSLKRENVSGVKPEQMLQAIAKHGGSQAFHISRLEHASDIQSALTELRDEDIQAMNKGERYSVYGTVARGLNGMFHQDPTTGWGSVGKNVANTAMGTLYYSRLALNPAFWATSAMSPAVLSMPYVTARHKVTATYRAWGEAMKDSVKILTPRSFEDYMRFSFSDQIKQAGLSKGEADMLQAVADSGGIDQSQIRELNDIARDNIGKVDDAKRFMAGMAHRAEVMSRLSSALAAYRLELKKNGGDQEAATKYAIEVVDNTLINYTHAHTPFLLRNASPTQKVLLQFARYQMGMNQLIMHNFREAFGEKLGIAKPVSAETREEARKKFYALLTAHSLATGTSGLFGLSLVNFALQGALSMFYPDDDEPDLEQKAREMLDAALGTTLSTAVRKGLPAVAGLDLSGRMGMQDMLNVRRDNPFSGDRHKMKENAVNAVPALSHAIDWLSWAKDPKTKTFPVAFISNIAKGVDLNTNGMTNTHGVVKKGAEDYSFGDVVLQSLGFTPTESTEAYARQDADRRSKEAIGTTRQALLDDLYAAMRSKDKEKIASIREKIREFSARHQGDKKAIITQDTITKSFKQRKKREQGMNDYGIAP